MASLLDSAFRIPVVNIRIGWDPILGLIPGGGDAVSMAIALYIVYLAYEMDVPGKTLARMLGNVLVDTVVGAVPVVGDAMDIFFKANLINLGLMENHLRDTGQLPDEPEKPVGWLGRLLRKNVTPTGPQPVRSATSLPPAAQTIDIVSRSPRTDRS